MARLLQAGTSNDVKQGGKNMLYAYPAVFIKEELGYTVIFPDLNHLATCGENLKEAEAMAVDCLAGYLYEVIKDNIVIPAASDILKINPEDTMEWLEMEPCEAFVNMVTVDVDEYAKKHF